MQINFIGCITQLFLVSKNGNECFSCNSSGFCFLCGHFLLRLRSGEAIFRGMTAAEACASCLSLGTITPALLHQILSPCTAVSQSCLNSVTSVQVNPTFREPTSSPLESQSLAWVGFFLFFFCPNSSSAACAGLKYSWRPWHPPVVPSAGFRELCDESFQYSSSPSLSHSAHQKAGPVNYTPCQMVLDHVRPCQTMLDSSSHSQRVIPQRLQVLCPLSPSLHSPQVYFLSG